MNKYPIMHGEHRFIGPATLMRRAYAGEDLTPLGSELLAFANENPVEAGADALMDVSIILQLTNNRDVALTVQDEALRTRQLYHLPAPRGETHIRLLALMAPGDLMANTPLDFLLEGSDIALDILYVAPHLPLPEYVPEHDVLFVAVGESDATHPLLQELGEALQGWPRPVLNAADRITWLSRDRAYTLLNSIPGVVIPATERRARPALEAIGHAASADSNFPFIIRPVGSHAGHGLEKMDQPADLLAYLQNMPEQEFYVSRFIDYRDRDGLFRKYRVVLIEGRPYACHMGVSAHWMIHYMNAGMNESADKRAEEQRFMAGFDTGFALRHKAALRNIYERMRLDYLILDCAETQQGELLLFEVDNSAVVHAMDPVDLFPYKQPQMRKVFDAFRDMLVHAMERAARPDCT